MLSAEEVKFNKAHCKTRRIVECAFGVLKARFACLATVMRVKDPKFAAEIFKCCCILHNVCLTEDPIDVANNGAILNEFLLEDEEDSESDNGDVQSAAAQSVRQAMIRRFV